MSNEKQKRAKLRSENNRLRRELAEARGAPLATQQGRQQQIGISVRAQQFSGPLPHPDILASYDQVVPGLAGRLADQAERQADHRQQLEKKVIDQEHLRSILGVAAGFVVALAFLAGGVYMVHDGHDLAGGGLAGSMLATLVGTFVYGTKSRRRERETKYVAISAPPQK